MTQQYTPIGFGSIDIDVVKGTMVTSSSSLGYVENFLQDAIEEYGETVRVVTYPVDHGWTNRDGVHTSDVRTHYKLVYEGPIYSFDDQMAMINERIRAARVHMLEHGKMHKVPDDQWNEVVKTALKIRNVGMGA